MPESPDDLTTPLLLLAMPQVVDPFFHKSVILLLHHQDEGSFGFIVNRATEIELAELLEGMSIEWTGPEGALAHFGGPVQPEIGSVLFAPESEDLPGEATALVHPGLAITQHIEDLGVLAAAPPASMRLFLGYAGWGEGQLVEEILRNDWLTAPVQPELVFATKPEAMWGEALRSIGIDPANLPSWTNGGDGGDEEAN